MPETRPGEQTLRLQADERFHRREWIIQRVGWGIMSLLVVAAAAGLLGSGLLSRARVGDERSLLVEFNRFGRLETVDELRILVGSEVSEGGVVRIWIDRELLERGEIQQFTPQPSTARGEADRVVLKFDTPENKPAVVTLSMRWKRAGLAGGRIGIEGGAVVSFDRFIYP